MTGANAFAVDYLVESFDGTGENTSSNGSYIGLDLPDWSIQGDPTFADGSLVFINETEEGDEFGRKDFALRSVGDFGSFSTILDLTHLDVGSFDSETENINANSSLFFLLRFGRGIENTIAFGIHEYSNLPHLDDDIEWNMSISLGGRQNFVTIPRGDQIQIGIDFDANTNQAQVWYDQDGPQGEPRTYFRSGTLRPSPEGDMTVEMSFGAVDGGIANGGLAAWSIWPHSVTGDFDGDGVLGVSDVDLLVRGFESSSFLLDLNSSDHVDDDDLDYWIHELANTYFGDSNLDGEFNSADLVNVFVAGEYEDAIAGNSTWATGDWSGNGEFDSADLVLAFQDGGYELGPREAVRSVPEPDAPGVAVAFGFLIGWLLRRRRFVA